jgi:hypothetical protein
MIARAAQAGGFPVPESLPRAPIRAISHLTTAIRNPFRLSDTLIRYFCSA